MNISILIGIGAGLASSALFASAWSGTALGVLVLFLLSPLPVAIAGLGWGWASGAVAAAAGTVILGVAGGPPSGLIYLLALGAPSAVFAYYAQLNRSVTFEASDNSLQTGVEWYPLGRLVGWACVWGGVLAALSMFSIGSDVAAIRGALQDVLEKTLFQDVTLTAGRALTAEEKTAFAAMMTQIYPWAIATLWLAIAMLNWWAAAHVTARSGRLSQPWPDLAGLRLPPQVPLAFGLSLLALLFTSGMAMLVASGFAGAFMFGLMLVGLGLLHRITRGTAARPFLLGIVYTALVVMPFTSLIVALIGLGEPYIRHRMPPAGPAPPPDPAA
jgi:hypothetical protein